MLCKQQHDSRPAAPKRGFACGDNASRFARLGHARGVLRQWTRDEAQAAARKAVEQRRLRRLARVGRDAE